MLSFVYEPDSKKDYSITGDSDNNNLREVLVLFYMEVKKLIRKFKTRTQGHPAEEFVTPN